MTKSKSHPLPTKSTLKELYAHAYRCALTGCTRPLYTLDNETGERTLNAYAIPICALQETHPRWDKNQTKDGNLSSNNFIALCLEHALEADDPNHHAQYPVSTLRLWKKQQLIDFDLLGKQGWSLREEDLEKLLLHLNSTSIVDQNDKEESAQHSGNGVKSSAHTSNGEAHQSDNTATNLIDKNNNVINIFRAKSEKAGHPSSQDDIAKLARPLTKEECDNGAGITTILLAEVIQLKDGLANLLGACWDQYKVPSLPFSIPLPLFLIFSLPNLSVPSVIHCKIRVKNTRNQITFEESVTIAKLDHNTQRVMHIQSLTIEATQLGIWTIEVLSGDRVLATQTISVTPS